MSKVALEPEVVYAANDVRGARFQRLTKIAQLLDSSIQLPGTKLSIGLDAIVGLVPGWGDVIAAGASSYIIYESARLGASRITLLRMIGNVALDTVAGAVPIVGDFFDAGWKANLRNIALLEKEVNARPASLRSGERTGKVFLGFALMLIAGLIGGAILLSIAIPILILLVVFQLA